MPNSAPESILKLSQQVGNFIQYWGFKRVHGQIWTLIFLSKEPLNSTMITKKLKVSKALVSLAIKDLLQYEVIETIEKRNNKEIFFQSNPNILNVIRKVLESRECEMLQSVKLSYNSVRVGQSSENATNFPLNQEKLDDLGKMIDTAQSTLKTLIQTSLFF